MSPAYAAISEWSGVAYGAAFFTAALTATLWGRLGDRYGRKLMLIRASLGMAVAMTLLGMALRLLAGLLGGYASGSTILVATQTPKARTGWALGMLSSGIMAGNLVGPLIGGTLLPLIGIRGTFMIAGGAIFIAFLATVVVLKEVPGTASRPVVAATSPAISPWRNLPVMAMLITGTLLMLANMSIEPIIMLYVAQPVSDQQVTFVAGLVMAAAALGSILSSSRLGRLADRVGHWRVIIGCLLVAAVLLIPQAFVTAGWQLVAQRFCMGLALGGLLPCIASVIRYSVPAAKVGGHLGMRPVFLGTYLLLAVGAGFNQLCRNAATRSAGDAQGRP